MGVISETVVVKWNINNIKHFVNKGYVYTKLNNEFKVNVNDLSAGSSVKVLIKCDECEKRYEMKWNHYNRCKNEDNTIYCNSCAHKLYAGENMRKTRLKNSITFQQWCIENDRQDVLNRWDYDLNNYLPNEISYASCKKCWFKCSQGIHQSELKDIHHFTNGHKGSIVCNQCNSIGQYLINIYGKDAIEKYWSNKNVVNSFLVDYKSNKKVWIICSKCGHEKNIKPKDFVQQGLGCQSCSDGISYPEKFIESLLQQLNVEHISQLSKTTFKWCDRYKYDKYLIKSNIIIEIHGIQHYEESRRGRSLKEDQENDEIKKQLAYSNGFNKDNYIVIDTRCSSIEHINKSVMESKLPQLLSFKEEDIDWLMCNSYGLNSFVKTACDLWNSGIHNTYEISNIMKVHSSTILKYLKQGLKYGFCNYDIEEVIVKRKINASLVAKKVNSKKVVQLSLDDKYIRKFESGKDANNKTGINCNSISQCCRGEYKTAGGYHWMFYEDYRKQLDV